MHPKPDAYTHNLENELALILQGKNSRSEILYALKGFVSGLQRDIHPEIESVNKSIIRQCAAICSIHLSEEDLRAVWK